MTMGEEALRCRPDSLSAVVRLTADTGKYYSRE
eukprot:CAMPEP_0203820446 /NCGR_PEP_ID=MMETSP0115-20131106/39913_1 /ASSEMBLY_ACC=CAM_ASM_000227 /TAXON_ID=33651 /ORGANISM="Bicosoecid sp, Strain ms1" /LENGTH=32 /DNA_ID= /DNA_START= /DNA_END= /DNA_ORIENTATION=